MAVSERMRSFLADTLALVVFFSIASGLNERFVAGMSWHEVLVSRGIGAPLMIVTARPYGLWRDWVHARFDVSGGRKRLIVDAGALISFQVPIYVAIIAAGGARGADLVAGALGFTLLMFVLGRPYGIWLDFVRRAFGLSGPGQKPMSLDV